LVERRPDRDLPFVVDGAEPSGVPMMLDTCVYIDALQGRTTAAVDDVLGRHVINHSAVALGELTRAFGRLDPGHPRTRPTLDALSPVIRRMSGRRLTAPSVRAAAEAGMLAGLLARLSGRTAEQTLLNDALMLLHAFETGCVLMTRNLADFDPLQQLVPQARVLFYRTA
jgi:predicted nucleic acid-binding protein